MELRLLKYFLAVSKEENITRRAEILHISQPSLSKRIMDLEEELGKQLIIRGKKKISLTEDGYLLRKRCEEIIELTEKTEREIKSSDTDIRGVISIGGTPTKNVLRVAAIFREKHPNVRFNLVAGSATDVMAGLDHGNLDFVILIQPFDLDLDMAKYDYMPLNIATQWGLFMPSDCEMAKKDTVSVEDFRKRPVVAHSRIGLQREISAWAGEAFDLLNIAATYNVMNCNLSTLVLSGIGYLLTVEDRIPVLTPPGVCFRPLDPPIHVNYAIIWKKTSHLSRGAKAFKQELEKLLQEDKQNL